MALPAHAASDITVANAEAPGESIIINEHIAKDKITVFAFVSEKSPPCGDLVAELRAMAAIQPLLAVRIVDIDRPGSQEPDLQSPAAVSNNIKNVPRMIVFDTRGQAFVGPIGLRKLRQMLNLPLPPLQPAQLLLTGNESAKHNYLDLIISDPSAPFFGEARLKTRFMPWLLQDSIVSSYNRRTRSRTLGIILGGGRTHTVRLDYDGSGRLKRETLDLNTDGETDIVRELHYERGRVVRFDWTAGADHMPNTIKYSYDRRGNLTGISEDLNADGKPEMSIPVSESRISSVRTITARFDSDNDSKIEEIRSIRFNKDMSVHSIENDINEDSRIDVVSVDTYSGSGRITDSRRKRMINGKPSYISEIIFDSAGGIMIVKKDRDADGAFDFIGSSRTDADGRRKVIADDSVKPVAVLANGAIRVMDAPGAALFIGEPAEFLLDLDLPFDTTCQVWLVHDTVSATIEDVEFHKSPDLSPRTLGYPVYLVSRKLGYVHYWRIIVRHGAEGAEQNYYFSYPVEWVEP